MVSELLKKTEIVKSLTTNLNSKNIEIELKFQKQIEKDEQRTNNC